jgi:hypothetical protein
MYFIFSIAALSYENFLGRLNLTQVATYQGSISFLYESLFKAKLYGEKSCSKDFCTKNAPPVKHTIFSELRYILKNLSCLNYVFFESAMQCRKRTSQVIVNATFKLGTWIEIAV